MAYKAEGTTRRNSTTSTGGAPDRAQIAQTKSLKAAVDRAVGLEAQDYKGGAKADSGLDTIVSNAMHNGNRIGIDLN